MTSNYTRTGTDLDSILITQTNKNAMPPAFRKSGPNSIWGQFGYAWGWGDTGINSGYPDYVETIYSAPTVISTTGWIDCSIGSTHSLWIDYENKLYVAGMPPSFGETAGVATTNTLQSPAQVGSLTNWSKVSAGYYISSAIKTDGTLWTWGLNNYYQLGDGTFTIRSSPVQIGTLTTWASIAAGYRHMMAIKTDGTLWTWGYNAYGELGLGDIVHRSSPVQVGALTTWSKVSAGVYYSLAVKTDGTLWAWGNNDNGQVS